MEKKCFTGCQLCSTVICTVEKIHNTIFNTYQTAANARFMGSNGQNNHAFAPMFYSHTGGAGAVVGDKFLMAAGKDLDGNVF